MCFRVCARSSCLRFVSSNFLSLLLFALVIPLLCAAYTHLRLSVFLSTLCTLCMHSRAPYSHTVARAFARIVVMGGPKQTHRDSGDDPNQLKPKCFVVKPKALGCINQPNQLLLEQMTAWAAVLLSTDERSKPLNVVTELPTICNAPGIRLLFQLSGFVDYRAQSIAKLLARGHSLLLFDETLVALQAQKCDDASGEIVMMR